MAGQRWTELETEMLRRHYADSRTDDLARVLGRPVSAVYAKANTMGLRKSAAYLDSVNAGRIQRGQQHPRMVATQFKPGHQTWNAGVKGVTGHHPNSRRTQFKPGRPAHESPNYLPIGSLRVARGVLERKVTDDPTIYPARRWQPESRLVWQATHGPIPRGYIVVFKPGCATVVEDEITADRLECISRAENARRNHPRSKSPELARLTQLKGAITRQVNRIVREHKEAGQAT